MTDDDHYPLLATTKPYVIVMVTIQIMLILIAVILNLAN